MPLWAGILLGMVLGMVLLVVGAFFWGVSLYAEQATAAMNEHPVIQRCIGRIEHSSLDWSATYDDSREDTIAFRVRGPKGSGLIVGVFDTVDADNESLDGGELHMDNGKLLNLESSEEDDNDTQDESCS